MFSGAGTLRFSSCPRGRASAAPRRRIPSVPAAVFPLPPPGGSPPPAKGCSSSDPCRGIGEAADPRRPAPEAGIFRRPQYTRFLQLLKQQRRPHFPLSAAAPVSGLIFPLFRRQKAASPPAGAISRKTLTSRQDIPRMQKRRARRSPPRQGFLPRPAPLPVPHSSGRPPPRGPPSTGGGPQKKLSSIC